jgi:biopolymer transport protein TolQ
VRTLVSYRARTLLQGEKGAFAVAQTLEAEAPAHEQWCETLRERFLARARLLLAQLKRDRESGLAFLATVASAAPFVGLFGTVWGIMNSFAAIAQSKNTSLEVVAPGIAEALLATAIGLFAAIPAAIFYNRLSMQVARSLVPAEELVQEMLILRARQERAK